MRIHKTTVNISAGLPIFVLSLLLFFFSGCFSPWTGDGTLTISFTENARYLGNPSDQLDNMEHEVILEGPGGVFVHHFEPGTTGAAFSLATGTWSIKIRAIGDRTPAYSSLIFPQTRMLRALGYESVNIKAGRSTAVQVKMTRATEINNYDQMNFA